MSRTAATTSTVAAVTISNTTQSTDKDTGALIVDGGVGVEKNLNVGGDAAITGGLTVTGDLTVNGTTTTLNTATVESEDNNILLNKGGNDASAEGGGIDVKRNSDNGALRFDSTLTSKWKLGLASAMYEVLITGLAQTITGVKTFMTELVGQEISTPTTPASGYRKIYPKSDGWYDLDDAGNETQLGGGESLGYTTTATAAGTTTLTAASDDFQVFTGSTTQIVALPNCTTLTVGRKFHIYNRSTGALEIRSNGGSTLGYLLSGQNYLVVCTSTASADNWIETAYFGEITGRNNLEITATTASGTKTLDYNSPLYQVFTGTATGYEVLLPNLTTSSFNNYESKSWTVRNESSQSIDVRNAADITSIKVIPAGLTYQFTTRSTGGSDWIATNVNADVIDIADSSFTISDNSDSSKKVKFEVSGITTATTRTITVADANIAIGKFPTIQKFTSGSGTYTTPAGVRYIVVEVVGGGGGGGGGGTGGGNGTSGGNTTFGSTVVVGNGGAFGGYLANGAGGTASLSGATGVDISGQQGVNGGYLLAGQNAGGGGGSSFFGGGGQYNTGTGAGNPAATNSGSGGAGGLSGSGTYGGGGGGAGGYARGLITSPTASYAYAVGAAGSGGSAGSGGGAGGAGAAGMIIVTEYYN